MVGSVWESEFAGFAKFIVVKKPATRKGINPLTKEPTVKARLVRAVKDAFA